MTSLETRGRGCRSLSSAASRKYGELHRFQVLKPEFSRASESQSFPGLRLLRLRSSSNVELEHRDDFEKCVRSMVLQGNP